MELSDFAQANRLMLEATVSLVADQDHRLYEMLMEIQSRPVQPERVSVFVEAVYANRELANDTVKEAAADVALFAGSYGFWGLGVDGRGMKIAAALRRPVAEEGDPAIRDEHQLDKPVPVLNV